MSMNKLPLFPKENTLEGLIEGLDKHGLMIFLILLGKQAMSILEEEKKKELKSNSGIIT